MVFGLGLLALALSRPASAQTLTETTYESPDTPIDIPDFSGGFVPVPGIAESNITITDDGIINAISVTLDIDDPFPTFLIIDLIQPNGDTIRLHNRARSLIPTYTNTTALATLVGNRPAGTWMLRIQFFGATVSVEMLNSWSIIATTSPAGIPFLGTASISAQQYIMGVPLSDLTLPAAIGGTGALSYTLARTIGTPALPPGLSFNPVTRTLSGTPSVAQTALPYTYRVTDAANNMAELSFTITIVDDSPTFGTAMIPNQRYSEAVPITDLTLPEAMDGRGTLSYRIVETLPPGLSFDPDTRTLSGTPTEAQENPLTYIYRVTDSINRTADLTFTIAIAGDPVAMDFTAELFRDPDTPATPTVTINFNDLIADGATADADLVVTLPFADPGVARVSGGTLESSDGTLENRVLTLDRAKMLEVSSVDGTPLAAHTFRYTVTDEDLNTDSATLTLLIDEQPSISVANREFTLSIRDSETGEWFIRFGVIGGAILPFSSLVTSRHTPHGELVGVGDGLSDPTDGEVRFFFPAAFGLFDAVSYTFNFDFAGRRNAQFTMGVYATNASIAAAIIPPRNTNGDLARAGDLLVSDTATFTFIIPNIAPVITPPDVPAYLLNELISLRFTADDENSHPVTFSLEAGAGAVPDGAEIDETEPQAVPATATLTWTPTEAGTFRFNVVADDGQADNNRATYPLTLEVATDTPPTFGTAALAAQTYVANNAIDPLTLPAATDGNGAPSYRIVESLPQGLSFNPDTRVLSGIPDTAQPAATYTYRVVDADSNVSASDRADLRFDITIETDTNPSFGSDVITPQSYTAGDAITPLTLPAATGGNAPPSYTLARTTGTPALPPGLSFDAGNRVLSGTPTTTQGTANYAYRVRDADGDVAELTFTITIIGAPPSALDYVADLYRNPDAPATPTFIINFNDLIDDSTTADADLEVTLPSFANPSVRRVSGGEIDAVTGVLTLDRPGQMLEVSSVAGTDLAVHEFDYTVTDEDGNTDSATLTLRIDERPTLSYANTEFTVTGFDTASPPQRTIGLNSGRELLTPASSHTPHGEEFRVIAVPRLANARRNAFASGGGVGGVTYIFTRRFTGRVSGTFTVGLYATANSIAAAVIPLMHANGDLVRAGDLLISASATFTFIVANDPPVLTPPIVTNPYPPNQEIELIFNATDTENHELSFSLEAVTGSTLPPGATFTPTTPRTAPATATFTWTPTDADAGTYSFNVVATETTTTLNTTPATTRFQVMLVIASPLTFSGTNSGAVTENALAPNNTVGDTLTLRDQDGGDEPFAVQTNEVGTYGSFSIDDNGNWLYTLDNADDDTNALAESTTVTDVFTVAANARPSATQDVTITITGANDAPTATISAPLNNVEVGTSTVVTLTGTGSDPDTGDAVTRYAWSADQGSFANADQADTTWTAPSDVGNVVLTLTVTDGNNATHSATITVRVVPVPVTITGDVIGAVTEDRGGFNRAMGDLDIDTRATLSTFVPQTDVSGTYGTFSINADGMWTYDIDNSRAATQNLAEGAMADDVFTVVAAARADATAIVTITVTGANEQPTASISVPTDGATVNAGVPVPLTGIGNDVDTSDLASLRYQWSTTPPNQGSFANDTLATTTWTPSDTAVGTDVTLTLTVTDASGAANDTATATVTVRVTAATLTISGTNTGAVTEDDNANNTASGALSIATTLADATFVPQTNLSGTYGTFSIEANGNWNYRLDNADVDTQALAADATATDVFTARANARPNVTQQVTLTVAGANDAPTVTIDTPVDNAAVDTGNPVTLTATGNDVDTGDEAGLSYQWRTTPPNRGSFTDATQADTTWTAPDILGDTVNLSLTVTDRNGATGSANVTVTTAVSLDLNGDDTIGVPDAQTLYYLALDPPPPNLDALLGRLQGTATDSELRVRAQNWLAQNPITNFISDLDNDRDLDQDDVRLLYYVLRFEDELQASPALRDALGVTMETLRRARSLRGE